MFRSQTADLNIVSCHRRTLDSFQLSIDENDLCAFASESLIKLRLFKRRRGGQNQSVCSWQERFDFGLFVGGILISAANQVLIAQRFRDRLNTSTDLGKVRVHQVRNNHAE